MNRQYGSEKLKIAIAAIKKKHCTIAAAAREFNIPKTTLYRRSKNPNLQVNAGKAKELTEEEENGLVQFMLYMAGQGFPMTRKMVRCYIREIFQRSGINTHFSNIVLLLSLLNSYNHLNPTLKTFIKNV